MNKELFLKIASIISPELVSSYNSYKQSTISLKSQLTSSKIKEDSFNLCLEKMRYILKDKNNSFLGIENHIEDKTFNFSRLALLYIELEFSNQYNLIIEKCTSKNKDLAYKLGFEIFDNNRIFIIDNHSFYENKGYGSLGLKYLLDFAKNHSYEKISGEISFVDWDDIIKLEHFYKKQGFEVTLDQDNKKGHIIWNNN